MKVVKTYGCTAAGFTIDGMSYAELTPEQKKAFESVVIMRIREALADSSLYIQDLIDCLQYDDHKCSEPCEQCGDSVSTTTWNI